MGAGLHQFDKRKITNSRNKEDKIYLEELWENKPCALFFLRRLGCPICRSYIQMIEFLRKNYEKKGIQFVCLSFEAFGEGSDSDRSFERNSFWNGPIYTVDKIVFDELFGRKGILGLFQIDKTAYERSKLTPGNMRGDGFQLGGQFVLHRGGKIQLEHRQKLFGDDASPSDILKALDVCLMIKD